MDRSYWLVLGGASLLLVAAFGLLALARLNTTAPAHHVTARPAVAGRLVPHHSRAPALQGSLSPPGAPRLHGLAVCRRETRAPGGCGPVPALSRAFKTVDYAASLTQTVRSSDVLP